MLAAIDRSTVGGRRDYALLVTMFITGARVQESSRCASRISVSPRLRIFASLAKDGKSASVRCGRRRSSSCVHSSPSARVHRIVTSHCFLITVADLSRVSACAISWRKYCKQAHEAMPTLAAKRLHPHSMRHSTAVHLLRSGVDMVTISQWLGHASVTTTNCYATVDLDMKRKAIEQARPMDCAASGPAFVAHRRLGAGVVGEPLRPRGSISNVESWSSESLATQPIRRLRLHISDLSPLVEKCGAPHLSIESGKPSFTRFKTRRPERRSISSSSSVLILAGRDVMGEPLTKRRELMERHIFPKLSEPIRYSPLLDARLSDLVHSVKAQGLEGLVAKRKDSRYEPGERSGAWLKMRVNREQEFVIGGYTVGGATFDALIFGYYEGGKLIYAARTRNGFTPRVRLDLMKRFQPLKVAACPFANLPQANPGAGVQA